MNGVKVLVDLEASLDVEWLTISDREDVGEKTAENVEGWKAHQPCHLIRDTLRNTFMLCYHRSV